MKKRVALIPIDNRPVCYQLPKMIANMSDELELLLPQREFLGDLKIKADREKLFSWLETVENVDCIILSLDTLAYGGLVSSRKTSETFDEIIENLNVLKNILLKKKAKVFAFSSIMRISNNNINEEEKDYWSRWGKRIFDWSYNHHKSLCTNDFEALNKHNCINNTIPNEILDDYLMSRKRNFDINKVYLDWLKEGIFSYLVYSKDDCAEYGLNVLEAQELTKSIEEKKLSAQVKTGADEIPLALIARFISEEKNINIYPKFTQPEYIDKISKYEDISVKESVYSQINLSGAKVVHNEENADFVLVVNNFKTEQGELVMNVFEEGFNGDFELSEKPFAVADILNANGADNDFIKTLLKKDLSNMLAYAGWNTTGNTIGSVLCMAIVRFCCSSINNKYVQKLLMTRFLDDWAYQANVRAILKQESSMPDEIILKQKMSCYEKYLNERFSTDFNDIQYKFPWDRFFEIEIFFN